MNEIIDARHAQQMFKQSVIFLGISLTQVGGGDASSLMAATIVNVAMGDARALVDRFREAAASGMEMVRGHAC